MFKYIKIKVVKVHEYVLTQNKLGSHVTCRASKSHVGLSDGVQIQNFRSPHAKGQFLGERTGPGVRDDTAVSSAKMAERIEMPFGLWTRVGPRKHALGGVECTLVPPG